MKQSPKINQARVLSALRRLDRWATERDWIGYDPYDVKGTSLGLAMVELKRRYNLPTARLLAVLEDRCPWLLRRALDVSPAVNAKGDGLFASAYLRLHQELPDAGYEAKARRLLSRLTDLSTEQYGGMGWGYPFDWRSRILIPAGTPSAVVSSVVGDAFWRAYRLTGRTEYLEVCGKVCEFFLKGLNLDRIDRDVICFSYTPLDQFHVHNANLFVAEFMTRVGNELESEHFENVGLAAARYALREQNEDGSIFYWGKADRDSPVGHIDHYHSGFEIRALNRIADNTGVSDFRDAAIRYFSFYQNQLLERRDEHVIPRRVPGSTYPIDIHACAEAILCTIEMRNVPSSSPLDLTGRLIDWIVQNMQHTDGWFVYRIRKGFPIDRRIEIPFMRWGQAWMMLALAEALPYGSASRPSNALS